MATLSTASHAPAVRPRWARLRAWPWRKILLITALVITLVAVVPPLRRVTMRVVGDVVLFLGAPFAPKTADFSKLPGATHLVAADGSPIGDLGADGLQRREPVALSDVPEHVRNAVLAAEDKDFYDHGGVDPRAVTRAFLSTLQGDVQGGSTITQQLAKLNYTAGERTLFRKFRELLYASKLERRYNKDELLERYLNQVYFGEGAYGLAAASRTFFGVAPAQLSASQAAMLAGKIRGPEALNPRTELRAVTQRRNQVLVNMQRAGWLNEKQYEAAVAEPITLAPKAAVSAGRAPHFVSFVEREAKTINALGGDADTRAAQLFTGGYTIETTLDNKTYDATVAAVQKRLGETDDPTTAAATVVPGDGAIRSLFGGLDFASTQFDMSSRGGRQAGSSFKPFVYMAALRDKVDPRSTFDGTSGRTIPCYGDKPVNNYAGEDAGGRLNVDDALAQSVNVVFVELGCKVGAKDVVKAAVDAGIRKTATTDQGAVFLGGLDGDGVNALDMASAFATFGARGEYARPYSIARIKDRDGKTVYEHKQVKRRAFAENEVGVINTPLQRVVREGTGKAAAIGRPVAGKTGTTQNNVDAWFSGYTPDLATAVWVGHAQPKPMTNVHGRSVTGGAFPAAIFGEVMRAAHRGIPVHKLPTNSPDELDLTIEGGEAPPAETTTTQSTLLTDVTVTTLEPDERPRRTTTTEPEAERPTTTRKPRSTTTEPPAPTTTPTTAANKKGQTTPTSSAPTTRP